MGMKKNVFKKDSLFLLLIMILSIVVRVSRFLPNVSPVAAMAIWAGANYKKPWAYVMPLIVMLISDFMIGFYSFPIMVSVYLSFVLIAFLGHQLLRSTKPIKIITVSLLSSIIFYLVTNLAVWLFSGMYPLTLNGLVLCYYYALPFLRNTLLGDMAYSGAIFLAWQYSPFFLKLLARSAKLIRINHPSFHVDA